MLALGLMTGTALDGFIDAALVETDGNDISALGAWRLHPYGDALRDRLAAAIAAARAWNFNGAEPAAFAEVEEAYTQAHAEAVRALLSEAGLTKAALDVIGIHGLTLLHRPHPPHRRTRQLGDGRLLAQLLGIDVVFDFRADDVRAGGEGSPLAPIYHAALLRHAQISPPAAVLNLGGVANITVWRGADDVIAFDTGPANGPINEWAELWGRGPFDEQGRLAAAGIADEAVIGQVLRDPYFSDPPPKSLDRYDFNASIVAAMSPEDGAATLTALSAAALARGLDQLEARPRSLIVCGGGRKNPVLMREIAERARVRVINADTLGWRGDAIEAEAFAFLAARRIKNLPISFPGTTRAPHPLTGGVLARASR